MVPCGSALLRSTPQCIIQVTIRILSGLLFLAARILVEPGAANAQTIKTYNYTGPDFATVSGA